MYAYMYVCKFLCMYVCMYVIVRVCLSVSLPVSMYAKYVTPQLKSFAFNHCKAEYSISSFIHRLDLSCRIGGLLYGKYICKC